VINKWFEESSLYLLQRAFFSEGYMVENGFYKVKQDFIDIIKKLGGIYKDAKERPIFCCFEDKYIKGLFWMIPTSNLSHRSPELIAKINNWVNLPSNDIRSNYYHIGHTNKPAVYRISNCFPITEKYIEGIYVSQGKHLILRDKKEIEIIRRKLSRILFDESKHPNKYEQHITSIKNYLLEEIAKEAKELNDVHKII